MDVNLLQELSNNEEGYHPLLDCNEWRVAVGNTTAAEPPHHLQQHLETDEVFVVLKGMGEMLVSSDGIHLSHMPMEQGKIYNVPKGVWHAHQMCSGSQLLIVENANTCDNNSPIRDMPAENLMGGS